MLLQLEGVFFVTVLPLDEISVSNLLDDPATEPLLVELAGDGVHDLSVYDFDTDRLLLEGLSVVDRDSTHSLMSLRVSLIGMCVWRIRPKLMPLYAGVLPCFLASFCWIVRSEATVVRSRPRRRDNGIWRHLCPARPWEPARTGPGRLSEP